MSGHFVVSLSFVFNLAEIMTLHYVKMTPYYAYDCHFDNFGVDVSSRL